MKITGKQAAEILGLRQTGTIRRLIEGGQLQDFATHIDGARKHFVSLDEDEVRAYARTLTNGSKRHRPNPPPIAAPPPASPASEPSRAVGITSQLGRIEKKLDQLLALWA